MLIVPPIPKNPASEAKFRFFFKVWTLDFRKWGQKRPLNGMRKRDGKTHTQTETPIYLRKALAQRANALKTDGIALLVAGGPPANCIIATDKQPFWLW